MARQVINAVTLLHAYPTLPIGAGNATLALTSNTDQTDRYTALINTKTIVIAYNSDVSARTITFTSVADTFNRPGDITAYSIAAGKIAVFGEFNTAGWAQTSPAGLWIDVSDPKVLLSVITLP